MTFSNRELTNQYISTSYQDVLQQYPTGSLFYVLDGLGNVIAVLNSSSVGDLIITSNMTASMTVASASYAVTYSISNIVEVSTSFASASVSASYALSASYAMNGGGSGVVTGGSYNISASYASSSISASYASTSSNAQYSQLSFDSLFSETSSYTVSSTFADTASIAGEAISASYALTASYVDSIVINNSLVLPFQYSFSTTTTAGDPGKGKFRYNNTISSSITEIYFDSLTDGGLDITSIINSLKSGSYSLYIQQKDDSTKSSLFQLRSNVVDNTGWFTVPVTHFSTADGGFPGNNKTCAVYVINKTSLVEGQTYPITASWAITASHALNGGSGGTSLSTGSQYPITASWALNALTASYIAFIPSGSTESASYALTASYASFTGNNGLSIPNYDYSNLTYTGPLGQVSDCTYKVGGSSGTIVCIITALYSGAVFIGVSKSFG